MATKRLVVLAGTITVSQFLSPNFFNVEQDIKTSLRNVGFDVISVKTSYIDYFGYNLKLTIELNVFDNFTAEQARQSALKIIEDIHRSVGITTIKVFYDVNLAVAVDQINKPNQTVTTTPSGGLPAWQKQPVSNDPLPDLNAVAQGAFTGLGVSLPIVALVVVGYILLKR